MRRGRYPNSGTDSTIPGAGPRSLLYFYRMTLPSGRAHALQILRTTEALARAGAPVTLYTRFDPQITGEPAQLIGSEVAPNLRVAVFTWRRRAVWPLAWRLAVWKALGVRPHPPVVYIRQVEHYSRTLARLANRLRLPLIYEAHSIKTLLEEEAGGPEAAREWEGMEREIFRRAGGVVFTTAECERIARERFGWSGPSIVAPNAAPDLVPASTGTPAGPGAAPEEDGGPEGDADGLAPLPDRPGIVYVGQLYPWKGVDLLIEAMTLLPGRRLTIAGGLDPADLARTRELARARGVAERVEFLGQQPPGRVTRLLDRADVGVIPLPATGSVEARLFTVPLKLYEFWAARLPVVASDLPSLRALARDGETALLVPPSPEGIARGIARVLEDGALAARMREAGRRAASEWTWNDRARRILDFIASVTP